MLDPFHSYDAFFRDQALLARSVSRVLADAELPKEAMEKRINQIQNSSEIGNPGDSLSFKTSSTQIQFCDIDAILSGTYFVAMNRP